PVFDVVGTGLAAAIAGLPDEVAAMTRDETFKQQWPGQGPAIMCQKTSKRQRRSIVPINPLAPLMALLGLHREGGDRPGLQALDPDRLAGFLAIAVSPVVDPVQCSIDLIDQLALAVAGAKLDGPVGLG